MTHFSFYSRLIPLLLGLMFLGRVAYGTCDVPGALRTSNPTTSTITIEWNAVSGATIYQYMYRQVDSGSGWSSNATGSTSVGLTSLSASTTYEVQVRAYCGSTLGFSDFTPVKYFSTGAYFSPLTLLVPVVSTNGAALFLNSASSDVEYYDISYKKNTDLSWTSIATEGPTTIGGLSGLALGQAYDVRVRARYNSGSNSSDY